MRRHLLTLQSNLQQALLGLSAAAAPQELPSLAREAERRTP
jgi:hypothetical protein